MQNQENQQPAIIPALEMPQQAKKKRTVTPKQLEVLEKGRILRVEQAKKNKEFRKNEMANIRKMQEDINYIKTFITQSTQNDDEDDYEEFEEYEEYEPQQYQQPQYQQPPQQQYYEDPYKQYYENQHIQRMDLPPKQQTEIQTRVITKPLQVTRKKANTEKYTAFPVTTKSSINDAYKQDPVIDKKQLEIEEYKKFMRVNKK